ncbi:(deoxy)nucleoside triphosphate pyrophosphohydrolase [bacterium]|nr:(deoxy)nucleoside triphosphate pyrophosphohydrolase [bacterium]
MKPLLVTAAIIEADSKVLIAQRNSDSRFGADQWEFPGGKVEFLESPEQCIAREIKEETDLTITVESLLHVNSHTYSDDKGKLQVVLVSYICSVSSGEAVALDCQDVKWVDRKDLESVNWCVADLPIVQAYIGSLNF